MAEKTLERQTIEFIKMSGAGNDFVLVDNRKTGANIDWGKAAPALCDRHYGIGADGLLILGNHPTADFAMTYYNADGSSGGMCGNGGRCAAFLYLTQNHLDRVNFYAHGYVYAGTMSSTGHITLSMKDPGEIHEAFSAGIQGQSLPIHSIDTGSPHAVLFLDDLPEGIQQAIESNGILEISRGIRYSTRFAPGGCNVNFVKIIDRHTLAMRTYEKGVEGETLACGTGAIASAIIAHRVKGLQEPVVVQARSGEELLVSFEESGGQYHNVSLGGPAKVVFTGEYLLEEKVVSN